MKIKQQPDWAWVIAPLLIISSLFMCGWWLVKKSFYLIGFIVALLWLLGALNFGNFIFYFGWDKATLVKEAK